MGERAILKLNQNKNIGNKGRCAHPADVGESFQNGEVFSKQNGGRSCARKRNEKQRTAAKKYNFHTIKDV